MSTDRKPYRCPDCGELRFDDGHTCYEGAADQAAVRRDDV
jgi:hypothetical protein